PMAWQIVAPTPEEAALGAAHLTQAEIIDLNLACPAPNIARRRAGGHLLSDLKLTDAIIKAVRQAAPQAMTVKIRLGRKPDLVFLKELAAVIEGNGVDAVTLHPRLTTEKLKRRARWEYIGHLKEMVKIPVIGNGDVNSREDCLKMTAQTGCDGVMIGRAAVRRPWIFAEICGIEQIISPEFLLRTYEELFNEIINFFPPRMAIGRIKEFTWHFSTNLKFGHRLAARMQSLKDLDACLDFIRGNFIKAC
ncbi:MAG TPA: tRNA-dihydrouridine synthase family protein, partial [Desulfobacterales bacterium]|nr:tRNA-dihydrouridine synthase family protein [Desulfobacterales bacterium]